MILLVHTLCSIEEGGGFAGTMGETFQLMGSAMNFTYDAVPSIDGNYGNQVKKIQE